MSNIRVLDEKTAGKIAAGEVIERPAGVLKELLENAVDAGSTCINVDIEGSGKDLIRINDNGCGMSAEDLELSVVRHATSKIRAFDDLENLHTFGFRGEALYSVAAVSRMTLTSCEEGGNGNRIELHAGKVVLKSPAPSIKGTTVEIRNLFYNTPPRKKFLKQPQTEGSYVADLMEHLAMSNPDISFKFILNGQNRFYTTGNNDLKEIIYRIYGKEISKELIPLARTFDGMSVTGLLGKPVINRSNRNYEIFYINGRYIRSTLISKAIEEG